MLVPGRCHCGEPGYYTKCILQYDSHGFAVKETRIFLCTTHLPPLSRSEINTDCLIGCGPTHCDWPNCKED